MNAAHLRPEPLHFRPAKESEADLLSGLTMLSKAHWGYSRDLLESWRPQLTITAGYIRKNHVVTALWAGEVVGFYAFRREDGADYLDHLWLRPDVIGRGFGRIAFAHALGSARELGVASFLIISDPNAEGFYLEMGAVKLGQVPSTPAGRMLSKLRASAADLLPSQ